MNPTSHNAKDDARTFMEAHVRYYIDGDTVIATETLRATLERFFELMSSQSNGPHVDRSDAVNLARNIRGSGAQIITDKGIDTLAEAVLRMDEALRQSNGPAEAVKAGEEMLARYILKNMDVPEGGDDANVRFLTEILLEHRRQCEARQSAGAERDPNDPDPVEHARELAAALIEARKELVEIRPDAARYRWLRYRVGSDEVSDLTHGKYLRGVALDRAIDERSATDRTDQ